MAQKISLMSDSLNQLEPVKDVTKLLLKNVGTLDKYAHKSMQENDNKMRQIK